MFKKKKIPVEICLTSNVLCKTAPSYENHHVTQLLSEKHPFVISVSKMIFSSSLFHWPPFTFHFHFSQTDDCGVFKTSLTKELKIYAQTFELCAVDLFDLTVNANQYSFANDLERQLIHEKIQQSRRELFWSDELTVRQTMSDANYLC